MWRELYHITCSANDGFASSSHFYRMRLYWSVVRITTTASLFNSMSYFILYFSLWCLSQVKHRVVESMSSATADALGNCIQSYFYFWYNIFQAIVLVIFLYTCIWGYHFPLMSIISRIKNVTDLRRAWLFYRLKRHLTQQCQIYWFYRKKTSFWAHIRTHLKRTYENLIEICWTPLLHWEIFAMLSASSTVKNL